MQFLLADEQVVARQGLRQILTVAYPGDLFLEAGTAEELLRLVQEQKCDLVLLDLNLPGRSGLDVLTEVKGIIPTLPVLVVSAQPEEQYAVECLGAGASGYMAKDSAPEELVTAVQRILSGRRYVSLRFAERLAKRVGQAMGEALQEQLSNRELEILRMIAKGTSLTEIAGLLHLSAETVSDYRVSILQKMRMKSNEDLARYAREYMLIE